MESTGHEYVNIFYRLSQRHYMALLDILLWHALIFVNSPAYALVQALSQRYRESAYIDAVIAEPGACPFFQLLLTRSESLSSYRAIYAVYNKY